jgi:hypothetical protein
MSKYSVILIGSNKTTGFGKTSLAKTLGSSYVKWQISNGGCDQAAAFVHITSTIDSLKDRNTLSGQCVLLDEFSPGDQQQNRNLSPEAMKVLLDVKNLGSVWTRFGDTIIPPCARIFTANHSNPQSWVGERFQWSAPMQRKSVCFVITKPLLPRAGAASEVAAPSTAVPGFSLLGCLRRVSSW